MPNEILQQITSHKSTQPVMSLYLDMSVNSDNKRTYQTFLNKQHARFPELDSDRDSHHREPMGSVLSRAEEWLSTEFDTRCKGAIIFAEIGGDWFHTISFPMPLANRLEVSDQPLIGPLRVALGNERRYCIVIVDREHLRLLSVYMGSVEEEKTVEPDAYPVAHDVQAGGYAQKDFQKFKAEETRKFFRSFAEEVEKLGQARRADGFVLLGTDENTKHFAEFLPQQVQDRIVHTAHTPPAAGGADLIRHLSPVFAEVNAREEARAIEELLGRVKEEHLATAGWHETLKELQEGKVDRLFIARDEEKEGVQCTKCHFYLVRREGDCPYCGGSLRDGVDLVESAVRMASGQDVGVAFIAADVLDEVHGVAALLKFR